MTGLSRSFCLKQNVRKGLQGVISRTNFVPLKKDGQLLPRIRRNAAGGLHLGLSYIHILTR